MKRAGWIAAALGIAVALWLMLQPAGVPVDTDQVALRTLTVTIEEQGRTRARDTFLVAAPITGLLLRPAFKVGDKVSTGTVLARISVPPDDRRAEAIAQANLAAAQARRAATDGAVAEAEGSFTRARRELERRQELAKTGVVTSEELEFHLQATDSAQARLQSLRAGLQAAEAEVVRARSQLLGSTPDAAEGILTVPAPVDGTIYRVFEDSERVISAGTPLYALGLDSQLEIVVELLTQDAVHITSGQPLQLTGWGGNETLQGNVTRVEPQAFTKISALGVEEQRVNVIGSLSTVPSGLGAGYSANVQIEMWKGDNVLTVPTSAVFRRDSQWQTFTVEDGRARLRILEPGHRSTDYMQVISGLAPGSKVIVFPSDLVADGVAVVAEE